VAAQLQLTNIANKLPNFDKWHFKISIPNLTRTPSAGSKLFPADRRKRQNKRPGRFDKCIVAIFNGDQQKMPITFDTAQVYTHTSLEKVMQFPNHIKTAKYRVGQSVAIFPSKVIKL
jgi:hypothetical protein